MAITDQRIYVGQLDISKVGRLLTVDLGPYSVASFQAVPRFGASLTSWECPIQRSINGSPVDFPTAIKFTASILNILDVDVSGTGVVAFTTSAGGTGVVDIYVEAKAGLGVAA